MYSSKIMQFAINLAKSTKQVPVAAVISINNKIITYAVNSDEFVWHHAEFLVVSQALNMLKNKPCKGKPYQGILCQDTSYHDISCQNMLYENEFYQNEFYQNTDKSYKDKSYKDKYYKNTLRQNKTYQDVSCQDISCQDISCQDILCQDIPCQDKFCKNKLYQDTSRQNTSCQNGSCQDTLYQDILCQNTLCQNKFLDNADLYVTLEPCMFCSALLNMVRIKSVYFGAYNHFNNGLCSCLQKLPYLSSHSTILGGFFESISENLLHNFFKQKRF